MPWLIYLLPAALMIGAMIAMLLMSPDGWF
jgi:hypothetical protein